MDSTLIKHFPILIFPHSLEFYLNSRDKHKTILTLYNPYSFPVRFTVHCNSNNKYTVVDSAGTIGPSRRVDLVVRHVKPTLSNCNVIDKFKIIMFDYHTKKTLGYRIVQAKLLESAPDTEIDYEEDFEPLSTSTNEKKSTLQNWPSQSFSPPNRTMNPTAMVIGVVSILILFIPTPYNLKNTHPFLEYLPADIISIKLVASFFLGLVTMAILKP
ncbi:motile sperm domain-containing protein 1-like [Chrysoperla carnea]|uniref:motile sperm domain-containing protein 1-like n=1 Tax=Chrysoperla carnea TaxID=189513 RepID=UPI001D082218|nr:motile sperm domain-containing protein 1-like [Chrysoperla carnea]